MCLDLLSLRLSREGKKAMIVGTHDGAPIREPINTWHVLYQRIET